MIWQSAFSEVPSLRSLRDGQLVPKSPLRGLEELRLFLDFVHVKFCLLKPFREVENYPLVEARDLLPSFEPTLTEYPELPGFSMVAFGRPLDYFNEVFQFDLLHTCRDPDIRVAGDSEWIGGIGVSGASESEDEECARAGLAARSRARQQGPGFPQTVEQVQR